jgi:hypothetical protein
MRSRQVGRGPLQADFARQLAERNAKNNPQKKARASAPKGTKLAAGYTDRTKARTDEEDSEMATRIKSLEESMKLGEIDRATFEQLVQDITGGDVGTTHLVKGLDRKLLERVRRGEDVLGGEQKEGDEEAEDVPEVEEAFDELVGAEIGPIMREKVEKKGEKMTTPPAVAGVKRSRNDILKELKRQREAAAAAAAAEHEKKYPSLGAGFRKVHAQGDAHRIETDDKGREVLIITGPDGKEKRKVKKQKVEEQPALEVRHDLDDASKPINMHNLPEPRKDDPEDEDIFEGVGSNYNPLANLDDEDDESDEEEPKQEPAATKVLDTSEQSEGEVSSPELRKDTADRPTTTTELTKVASAPAKRDYFATSTHSIDPKEVSDLSAADATVKAALAKVRNLDENSTLLQNLGNDLDSEEARLKKRAAELAASDRDMEDMDMGFGASRFDDADEMEREGEKVKFSQWKGLGAEGEEDDEGGAKGPKKERKRGGKKRKGDKNNPDDVLKVMERQKEKKTKTLG